VLLHLRLIDWGLRSYKTKPLVWHAKEGCKHEWVLQKSALMHKNRNNLRGSQENCRDKTKTVWIKKFDAKLDSGFCSKCGAWKGSLGLEPTFNLYIQHLVQLFDEAKRILAADGTLWVNLGDTYVSKGATRHLGYADPKNPKAGKRDYIEPSALPQNLPEKCLAGIPFRFAIEMMKHGWILRNTIIWQKPNCTVSSVKDRFTVDFEYVFFFVKQRKYSFEQQFEERSDKRPHDIQRALHGHKKYAGKMNLPKEGSFAFQESKVAGNPLKGRNRRCVWKIVTKPFKGAHTAVFPSALVEPMIKAGCPKGGIVYDTFSGAGTTALVAKKLGRHYLGSELNPEYVKMAEERIRKETNK